MFGLILLAIAFVLHREDNLIKYPVQATQCWVKISFVLFRKLKKIDKTLIINHNAARLHTASNNSGWYRASYQCLEVIMSLDTGSKNRTLTDRWG